MTFPNARDCEHGHQRGKCPECDAAEDIVDLTMALEAAESEARVLRCEVARLRKDAARYNWLAGKVFARGETCLQLIEEFGGAPFKGETIRQFVDRYIDEAMTANAKVIGSPALSASPCGLPGSAPATNEGGN